MKKRFLTLLLVLFALPCILLFSACESGSQPTELESHMITLEYSFVNYDGTYKEPEVTLRVNNKVVEEKEYEIDYINNLNVGMADVLVSAKVGSDVIKGEAVVTFEILRVEKNVSTLEELKNALLDSNYITINVTEDISLPSGDELEIATGKTVNFGDNKLTVLGEYSNQGIVNANVDSKESLLSAYEFANVINVTNDILSSDGYIGDITLKAENKNYNFTINLNEHTIEAELDFINYVSGSESIGNAIYTDYSIDVTINNGKIGGEFNDYGVLVKGDNKVKVTLNNGEFEGIDGGIYSNGNCSGATIIAENCSFKGNDEESASGAYLPARYDYTFKNCLFTGLSGYYTKSGNHILKDCTFIATKESYEDPSHNGNGCNETGSALNIDNAEKYQIPMDITIENCSFESLAGYGIEVYVTGNVAPYTELNFVGTQTYNVEKDNVYATYDIWDGTVGEVPAEVEENIIEIETAEQLAGLAKAVNEGNTFAGKTIKLIADIDLQDKEWTPIGYGYVKGSTQTGHRFEGTFDGQKHKIYNLKITGSIGGMDGIGAAGVGLFGQINGRLRQITVIGANVSGNHYVGVISGFTYFSDIYDCDVVDGHVSCTLLNEDENGDKAGIITGYCDDADITYCNVSNSTVSASRDAGQLIGAEKNNQASNGEEDITTGNEAINVVVTWNETGTGRNIENELVGRDKTES